MTVLADFFVLTELRCMFFLMMNIVQLLRQHLIRGIAHGGNAFRLCGVDRAKIARYQQVEQFLVGYGNVF